mgnify:CR=1 FL=1|tara:strand:- start:36344 stop:36679 length:336 start_codon:yes stop_codon:yes gene_type:complete
MKKPPDRKIGTFDRTINPWANLPLFAVHGEWMERGIRQGDRGTIMVLHQNGVPYDVASAPYIGPSDRTLRLVDGVLNVGRHDGLNGLLLTDASLARLARLGAPPSSEGSTP